MLRIIVISLVVANLLLLGFQSSTPAVQPTAKPASVAVGDSGIPTIHLFSEMMEDQGLLSGNRRCFTLGPFHSVADWDDVQQRLQKVATRISERQTQALVEKGYWVYMPPYPSLLEANKALLSLQALGLKDVAIMYDGEWKNSISLGYFMRQENAQRRKRSLEDRGFEPMMRIQRQAEPRFWLDYEQEPGSGLVGLDMQNRPNDFMQRPVPCPEAEFLEADAVATEDTGENLYQPQAPEGNAKPVVDAEKTAEASGSTEQAAQAPDQSEESEPKAIPGTGASQDAGNAAENTLANDEDGSAVAGDDGKTASDTANESETSPGGDGETSAGEAQATAPDEAAGPPDAGEAAKTTADDVDAVSNEVPDKANGGDAIPSPKQTVGTGPAHFVAAEPGPDETGTREPEAGNTAAGASASGTGNAGEQPIDKENGKTTAAPPADSGEQNTPEGTEKDSGNGTVDKR
jgi:hypothetical protein